MDRLTIAKALESGGPHALAGGSSKFILQEGQAVTRGRTGIAAMDFFILPTASPSVVPTIR